MNVCLTNRGQSSYTVFHKVVIVHKYMIDKKNDYWKTTKAAYITCVVMKSGAILLYKGLCEWWYRMKMMQGIRKEERTDFSQFITVTNKDRDDDLVASYVMRPKRIEGFHARMC